MDIKKQLAKAATMAKGLQGPIRKGKGKVDAKINKEKGAWQSPNTNADNGQVEQNKKDLDRNVIGGKRKIDAVVQRKKAKLIPTR